MWYNRIVQDLGNIPDFIVYYENELAEAKFWKEYGYAVDKFYKVEMSQVAR